MKWNPTRRLWSLLISMLLVAFAVLLWFEPEHIEKYASAFVFLAAIITLFFPIRVEIQEPVLMKLAEEVEEEPTITLSESEKELLIEAADEKPRGRGILIVSTDNGSPEGILRTDAVKRLTNYGLMRHETNSMWILTKEGLDEVEEIQSASSRD